MNIFFLDRDVKKCAEYHNNRHVVKMILESCQLLCTAHRYLDGNLVGKKYIMEDNDMEQRLYRLTHVNHPSAKWCRETSENYQYTYDLMMALNEEYTYRYGKHHKSIVSGLVDLLKQHPKNINNGSFFEPYTAMDDKYKIQENGKVNVMESYRNYYIHGKPHLAEWKNRTKPEWYVTQE